MSAAALHPTVDATTRLRRRLHLAATLASLRLRALLVPETSVRRRSRLQVCGAATMLTALGVRVRVVGPRTPWPRSRPCRLVVADDLGLLATLALVTAVPRTAVGWRSASAAVLPGASRAVDEPADADAVACPVAFRYRSDAGQLDRPPRTPAEIGAVRGLVVEVHLLPALDLTTPLPQPPVATAA